MTELSYWASILIFPIGLLTLVGFLLLLQRRDEARWAREAREHKSSGTPAE